MWLVYIIKSDYKEWYYVGSTNDLNRRIKEHNNGRCRSTKSYKPLKIVYTKYFSTEKETRKYEQRLKSCRIEKKGIIKSINSSGIV